MTRVSLQVRQHRREISGTYAVQGQNFLNTGTERRTVIHRVLIDSVLQIKLWEQVNKEMETHQSGY